MVRDNGSPILSSYFDVQIAVKDVNEPITGISIQPSAVPESVRPGKDFFLIDLQLSEIHEHVKLDQLSYQQTAIGVP